MDKHEWMDEWIRDGQIDGWPDRRRMSKYEWTKKKPAKHKN